MNKKNLIILALLSIIIVAIPLTVFFSQQQQDIRQKAAGTTTLTFNPASNASSPINKTINDPFSLEMMVNPADNEVSVVRFEVTYDPTKVTLDSNPFSLNTLAFPTMLEGPIFSSGKIAGTVTIGSDYSKAIKTLTRVATIKFKAIGTTGATPTVVAYTINAQVLSVGSNDEAAENVLSSTLPAYIRISAVPTPTPTSTPVPTSTPIPTPTSIPPTLTLDADPDIVSYNGSSQLMWTSQNATSCTASNAWSGTKALSGNQSTGPLTTAKTYTLICTGPGGSVTRSVTITVLSQPTPTPTRTPTPTSTPVPTNTPMPTATPVPQATQFNVTAFMHGIGNSGDNANPNSFTLSNKNPVRQQRKAVLEIFDANNNLILTKEGILNYSATSGNFTGIIDAGTTLTAGVYTVKVKTPQYLKKLFPGFVTVTPGQTLFLATVTFVTGDVVTDNALNILDYNVIVGCYSDFAPAISCTAQQKLDADLTDDGKVNQFDYNLFLRDLTVQNGE